MTTAFSFLQELRDEEKGGAIVQDRSGFPPNERLGELLLFFAEGGIPTVLYERLRSSWDILLLVIC